MKTIDNKVKTLKTTDVQTFLSWEFNTLKDKDRDVTNLKNAIIKNGFSFPVFLWYGHNYVIDGTGRRKAVEELTKEGYTIPEIPYVEVEAATLDEARQKVIEASSSFGEVTKKSLADFVDGDITLIDWTTVNLGGGKKLTTRKDVWEQEKQSVPENTGKKHVPEQLKPTMWKPGESGNPAGRPKGSRNLTTIVMEALKAKVYTVKNEANGQTTEITGEEAFAEAVLENAIKKKDRESLRMIWEMADGKPTQQHKLEVNGPKGYQVDPQRENLIHEQFGMYAPDRVGPVILPETHRISPVAVETQETAQTPDQGTTTPPVAVQEPKTGVSEPQPTHEPSTEQPTAGVQPAQTGNTGGVKEA